MKNVIPIRENCYKNFDYICGLYIMKRNIYIAIFVLVLMPGCKMIQSFLHNDDVVAEVGQHKLYRQDINQVVPKGVSPEDSASMAIQYINAWASDIVFMELAEKQLSKEDRDVSRELEDYRKSLLKYRYEKLFVNERLDTAVSVETIEQYYEVHRDKFVLRRPVVKARFLSISKDSPMLAQIKAKMSSSEVSDLEEADSLAYSAAMKYMVWNNEWIDASVLAREFSSDYVSVFSSVKGKWVEMTDTTGVTNVAYIVDITPKGQFAPIDYCSEEIKDIILSSRKQSLATKLERDLLNEARENGSFVIY